MTSNRSRTYIKMRGKMGARESRHSELLERDLGYSKPWKRKRKVRARLKRLQRKKERRLRLASLIRLVGYEAANELIEE